MTALASRPPLVRPRDVVLSGACAALARHLGRRAGSIRALFVLGAFLGGGGILLYLWLWAFVPLGQPESAAEGRADQGVRRALPVAAMLLAASVVAAVIALLFNVSNMGQTRLLPGLVESAVLGAAAVGWSVAMDRADPGRDARSGRVVQVIAACALLVEGVLLLIGQYRPVVAVLAVFLIVLAALILVLPRMIALWSELIGERSARAREEQRAEIAAHLHDSVLQTLALIQNRAGPQSEVARLARAQERELRDWLFAGTDPFAGDLATELRSTAAALELQYVARIEVVTVGKAGAVTDPAIVAAAREAMHNAARHAGGEVTVYAEVTADAVDVYVRDRGPGFDTAAVPPGRLGIRESIVGRMTRAGGAATVTSDPDGTEVHLHLPRAAA